MEDILYEKTKEWRDARTMCHSMVFGWGLNQRVGNH